MSKCAILSGCCASLAFWACIHAAPAYAQIAGLVVEPATPLEVPSGAERFHIGGTINNNQPVSAADPQFSADICDSLRADTSVGTLGEVRAQLTSDGVFVGTHIGEAALHAQACLLGPPPTIVARLTITMDDGDVLTLSLQAVQADSPPPPDSEAMGGGTVTGGTGRFEGATGRFNLSAKSHGQTLAGSNVSTHRDIDINGYIFLRAQNEP